MCYTICVKYVLEEVFVLITKEELVMRLRGEGFPVEFRDNLVVLTAGGDVRGFLQRLLDLGYCRSFGYFGEPMPEVLSLEQKILAL